MCHCAHPKPRRLHHGPIIEPRPLPRLQDPFITPKTTPTLHPSSFILLIGTDLRTPLIKPCRNGTFLFAHSQLIYTYYTARQLLDSIQTMSSIAPSRSLQASALTFLVLSIGHTVRLHLLFSALNSARVVPRSGTRLGRFLLAWGSVRCISVWEYY
jgi:hypothetical protein